MFASENGTERRFLLRINGESCPGAARRRLGLLIIIRDVIGFSGTSRRGVQLVSGGSYQGSGSSIGETVSEVDKIVVVAVERWALVPPEGMTAAERNVVCLSGEMVWLYARVPLPCTSILLAEHVCVLMRRSYHLRCLFFSTIS